MYEIDKNIKQGVAENVAGDVNSKKRYHFLYPHVPLDMHTDHEYNDLSDRDLQAVKSHQRELADKLGKPGAEEKSDIASHIQINRARSQYDQEQAHRRKVLDAEKIKRQARDAKRQQGVAEGVSLKQKYEDKKRLDQDQVRYGKMTQAEFDKKWTRTERPKPTDKKQGVAEGRRDYDDNRTGFGRSERDMSDESNLLYVYKNDRVQQATISNRHEREARAQGYRDTVEQALKMHGIVKSKFKPGKWVQKQGNSWTEVHPFGKPEGINEEPTAGGTSAANVGVGAVYNNKSVKQPKNKDGTAKNAVDMKGVNLLTGGSLKR